MGRIEKRLPKKVMDVLEACGWKLNSIEKQNEDWSAYIDATSEALGKVTLLQNAACTVLKEYDSFFDFLKDLKKMNEMGVHNFLCEIKEA